MNAKLTDKPGLSATEEMTAIELRAYAQSLGIKGAAKHKKADLLAIVAEAQREADAIAAEKRKEHTETYAPKTAAKKAAAEVQADFEAASRTRTTKGSVKTAKQMAAEILAETVKVTEAFAETPRKPLTKAAREASEAAIAAVKKAAGVVEEAAPAKAEKATKATKAEKVAAKVAERGAAKSARSDLVASRKAEKAAAAKAEPVARKKTKSMCSMPNCFRQQDKSIIGPELCDLHLQEADWENTHTDNAHDRIAAKKVAHADFGSMTASEYREWIRDTKAEMERCWTCHPDLNAANFAPVKHATGTSRAGMVMTVPVRGSGEEKAAAVVAALAAVKLAATVRVLAKQGTVVLLLQGGETTLQLTWSVAGKYDYAASNIDGHKVRNVSAALKAVGAA